MFFVSVVLRNFNISPIPTHPPNVHPKNTTPRDQPFAAAADLSLHDKNTDLALLQVENDRLTELSEMFKGKMESAKRRYEKAEMKERELERRCVELDTTRSCAPFVPSRAGVDRRTYGAKRPRASAHGCHR